MAARRAGNRRLGPMNAKVPAKAHALVDERAWKRAKKKARQFPAGLPLFGVSQDQKLR
jgi:hypothetical protein